MTGPSRRQFLNVTASSAVAALAASTETARGYMANDTIRVGCIGTGGRCRALMKALGGLPNARMIAVADIYEPFREQGKALADPKADTFSDYRALLDRKDIDAVLIASPDHWHVPMTIDACAAGKDVYVEKPLTHNLAEGRAVIEAQDKHKRVVQVGTQQRSMTHLKAARELIADGRIGRVLKVHLTWNRNGGRPFARTPQGVDASKLDWKAFLGNAPDQPFDEFRYRNWRWFWDFGGGLLTDLMVHWIDVVHWFLDLDHPVAATAVGNHVAAKGVWETPDTIQCLLSYPGDIQVYFEGTFSNARNGAMAEFMGSDATLYIDRGRYEIHPELNRGKPESMILGTDPRRGADFYDKPDGEALHLADWLDAVRRRVKPSCPAEAGVRGAAAAQLGNLAFRRNKVVTWDEAISGA